MCSITYWTSCLMQNTVTDRLGQLNYQSKKNGSLECMNECLMHRLDFLFRKRVLKTSLIFYSFAYYTESLNTMGGGNMKKFEEES